MSRGRVIAVVAITCVAAGSTSAAAIPPLVPGRVEVAVVAAGTNTWNPQVMTPVRFVVRGRIPPKRLRTLTIFMRYGGSGKCGPSYARGRGIPYGPMRSMTWDTQGYFAAGTNGRVVITRPEVVRLCVWPAPSARAVVAPTKQNVRFHDTLFAATVASMGSYWGEHAPWANWSAGGTNAFVVTDSRTDCQGQNVRTSTTTREPHAATKLAELNRATGPVGPLAEDQCNEVHTIAFRERTPTGDVERGSLTISGAERRAVPRPVKALGPDCALGAISHRSLDEVLEYLKTVGCLPGRLVPRRYEGAPMDSVVGFEIHGADARLVKKGTQVDIVVSNPRIPARP